MDDLTAAAICKDGDEWAELLGETLFDVISHDSLSFCDMGKAMIKVIRAAGGNRVMLVTIDATIMALGGTSLQGILEMTKAKE